MRSVQNLRPDWGTQYNKKQKKPGVLEYTSNPSLWKAEAGESL